MHYRSLKDLASTTLASVRLIPDDVDLVVGLPRSGLLAASVIALQLNLNFCSVQSYLDNRPLERGRTRCPRNPRLRFPKDARHVLILDDSVDSGASLGAIRPQLREAAAGNDQQVTFAAVYASPRGRQQVDLHFETIDHPQSFEWNLLHRPIVERFCVDLEGVLYTGPGGGSIEDVKLLRGRPQDTAPSARTSYPIGHLVTTLPEKYSDRIRTWLRHHDLEFGRIHHTAARYAPYPRWKRDAIAKGRLYRGLFDSFLYVTQSAEQAREIARQSAKSVLALESQEVFSQHNVPTALCYRARLLARSLRSVFVKDA